jgi:hypothetical protein
MFSNARNFTLALAAVCGFAATAQAVPVNYSFTTGTVAATNGVGAGLFGATDTAHGTFIYDTTAPNVVGVFNQWNWAGPGVTYGGSVANWEGFVGEHRFFDGVAGAFVGNNVAVAGGDAFGLTGTVAGGAWEPFSIDGNPLLMARIYWTEATSGGDFLTSNDLLAGVPSFNGSLVLFFGADVYSPTGWVAFNGLQATAVPEPSALLLLSMGLPMMWLARRRRSNRA